MVKEVTRTATIMPVQVALINKAIYRTQPSTLSAKKRIIYLSFPAVDQSRLQWFADWISDLKGLRYLYSVWSRLRYAARASQDARVLSSHTISRRSPMAIRRSRNPINQSCPRSTFNGQTRTTMFSNATFDSNHINSQGQVNLSHNTYNTTNNIHSTIK